MIASKALMKLNKEKLKKIKMIRNLRPILRVYHVNQNAKGKNQLDKLLNIIIKINYCSVDTPFTFKEVIESNDCKNWKKAMNKEIEYLSKNKTWKLVDDTRKKGSGCKVDLHKKIRW